MKVIINLLKFISITILTICLIALGAITIASSTVLDKNYVMQKLEETDFYSGTYKLVESNFENYIYQSGLDEEVLKSICTEDKVKNDINLMLSNIYDGTNKTIDTTEISTNLNANIDKLGIKTKQNEKAINEFVNHICKEYTDTKAEPAETIISTDTNTDKNTIKNYPEYGTQYATIEIDKIGVNLPVYYGDTLEILKKGVGHSSGSYFPGEGGSIVYMGHNSKKMFRRFSELQKGNEIKVTTSYGEYVYKIYDMQLIKETELDKLPIQRDKEILMVYTCYPFNNVGYATQRYVVYAELEK